VRDEEVGRQSVLEGQAALVGRLLVVVVVVGWLVGWCVCFGGGESNAHQSVNQGGRQKPFERHTYIYTPPHTHTYTHTQTPHPTPTRRCRSSAVGGSPVQACVPYSGARPKS
jgi:hypothetical protein